MQRFDAASTPLGKYVPLRPVVFDQAVATGLHMDLNELSLVTMWSEFEDCEFVQRRQPLREGFAPQGSFANRPSRFVRCEFRGVRFRLLGGFNVGQGRFEECHFDRCTFEGSSSLAADYVRCRFVGRINGCVFSGTDPETGHRNEIAGNDFTAATISRNVGWRGRIDLAAQRWPAGYSPFADAEL